MKSFREFSKDEQMEWAKTFHEFVTNKLPYVHADGKFNKDLFLEGMALVEPWPCSVYFVRDARMFHDYHARVPLLHQIIRQVQDDGREVIAEYSTMIAMAADALAPKKAGRPRNGEEEKREQAAETLGVEKEKVVDKKEKERITSGQLDLFSSIPCDVSQGTGEEEGDSTGQRDNVITTTNNSLRDIAWLVSADLAERIDSVAMLRAQAATEAEMAKMLAMKGAKQDEIAAHAEASAKCVEAYQKVYKDVDVELATLYIGNHAKRDYMGVETKAHKRGISSVVLMSKILLPYYQKMVKEDAGFEARALLKAPSNSPQGGGLDDTETSAEKEKEEGLSVADKQKLRQRARSYFNSIAKRDRDKVSEEQVKKMEEYVVMLKDNGIDYEDLETKLKSYQS